MSEDNLDIEAIGNVFGAAIEVMIDARPDDPMIVEGSHSIRYALVSFVKLATGMGPDAGGAQPAAAGDLGAAGNRLLSLTPELVSGVENAGLVEELKQLRHAIAGLAVWLARAGAQVQCLDPVSNAFAALANETHEPERLTRLGYLIEEVITASDPGDALRGSAYGAARSWYVMHANWGIVATRSLDTTLMKHAFDRMSETIPAELPSFFRQAMAKMEQGGYPEDVKALIRRYHDR